MTSAAVRCVQDAPHTFWPVVQMSALAAVATYVSIYYYWRRMPNYAHRKRISDVQVCTLAWRLAADC